MRKSKDATEQATKSPIYIKWWLWVIIAVLIAAACANVEQNQTAEPDPSPSPSQSESPASTPPESDPAKRFVAKVKDTIKDEIDTKHESIVGVVLLGRDLLVYVDFSNVILEPLAPITLEDVGLLRTSSITDAILELDGYDDLWDTITVDFGEIGHITNYKDDIETNEYGRFFPAENFEFDLHDFP